MRENEKYKELASLLEELFPMIRLSPYLYGNKESELTHIHFNIPPQNSSLIGSDYCSSCSSFVHFTKLKALEDIVKSGKIRLYNLHNLNDPREFIFAGRLLRLDNEIIAEAQENMFIISMCESSILKSKNQKHEFNLWRLYGDNGYGAAIEFSLENPPNDWINFHLSKINYGIDPKANFKYLSTLLEQNKTSTPSMDIDLSKLLCFHKSNLFDIEKEIRIVFDNRKLRTGNLGTEVLVEEKKVFPITQIDTDKRETKEGKIKFLELPIYPHQYNFLEKEIPLLKIKKIVLGYQYNEDFPDKRKEILDLCEENLGYKPEIASSRLRKYFWNL